MKALLIIDMQNDFMPGGPLGVSGADLLVPKINALIPQFPYVVASMDWHSEDHVSFADNHPGHTAGQTILVNHVPHILWPRHCVKNTRGADLTPGIKRESIDYFCYKGIDSDIESYSAFFDIAKGKSTGLDPHLKSHGITDLYLTGVATDYCVLFTALDALHLGYRVFVIADACRAVNLQPEDEERALHKIVTQGGTIQSLQNM